MKKYLVLIVILALSKVTIAQSSNANPAVQLANHIADKMRDTLSLTNGQRGQIFSINMQLHNQKQAFRQQYSNQDSLRIKVQGVEKTRDSLYRGKLSEAQYLLYKQKKRNLVRKD